MSNWHQRVTSLFEQHSRRLVKFATKRLRDQEIANEIVQDVYVRVLKAGSAGEETEDVKVLYTSVRNAVTDHHRSNQFRRQAMESVLPCQIQEIETNSPEDHLEANQALSALDRALMSLRPQAREIFILHRVKGVKNAEIAKRYGISVSAVEKQLARVMRHCQESLDRYRD